MGALRRSGITSTHSPIRFSRSKGHPRPTADAICAAEFRPSGVRSWSSIITLVALIDVPTSFGSNIGMALQYLKYLESRARDDLSREIVLLGCSSSLDELQVTHLRYFQPQGIPDLPEELRARGIATRRAFRIRRWVVHSFPPWPLTSAEVRYRSEDELRR